MQLIDYAKSHIGIPYSWGGENPVQGFDCSGFAQWILKSVGMDPKGDQSAQALYDWSVKSLFEPNRDGGALAFYGKDPLHIIHVAFLLNQYQIIEAGGGDHTCVSREVAAKKGACVRVRMIEHRPDLVGIFMPNYPDWVKYG